MVVGGLQGWGVMMYGYSGYSYLLSYGKAVAARSQAVIELLALLSLSFSFYACYRRGSVGPPFWSRLKYLNNFYMHFH